MKARRKPKPDPAPPTHPHRCDMCGVAVERRPFEPDHPTPCWRRCPSCADTTRDELGRHALAAAGIEHDPDDPALLRLLNSLALWAARYQAADARPDPEAEALARITGTTPERVSQPPKPDPRARPWGHLDARRLRQLLGELRAEHAAAEQPKRCTDGVCGCCGVRTSVRWWGPVGFGAASGLSTGPRPKWPVCATCWPHLEGAGGDPTSERARRRWTAIVLGKPADPPVLSIPAAVAPYARWVDPTTAPTEAEGVETPWSWVSDDDRAELGRIAPQHRPDAVVDREARAHAALARLRAEQAAREPRSALVTGDDL